MKKIAVKRSDGGVTILVPTKEASPELLLRDALAVDGYVSHREIDDSLIPEDRTFRNAWTDDFPTESIDVDITKAQEIKKDIMREIRAPLLQALDIDYMKALEANDAESMSSIAAKKQELRDVTKIELPTNVEELKIFLPNCLKA